MDFVGKVLDWQRFGEVAQGRAEAESFDPEVQDGELAGEHFTFTCSSPGRNKNSKQHHTKSSKKANQRCS